MMSTKSLFLPVVLFVVALAGCELLGLGKDGDTREVADECGPTDLEPPGWIHDPDVTGNLWYVTGMKLFPSVVLADVMDSRPVVHDRVWFHVYPLYLRLDTTEVETQFPALGNTDSWHGEYLNPHDRNATLSMNRAVRYKGDEVPANTNLLDLGTSGQPWSVDGIIYAPLDPRLGSTQFNFDTSLFEFDPGCYEVYAGYSDEDGHVISDTTSVYIDLD